VAKALRRVANATGANFLPAVTHRYGYCHTYYMSTMNNVQVIKKSTRPPHFGECDNKLSFDECYEITSNDPGKIFHTTGNQTPFSVRACLCKKGPHANDKVIIFFTKGTEKARAYSCCWGHITNCNRTYIDCFTKAIDRD
jgi:hypothetical protein